MTFLTEILTFAMGLVLGGALVGLSLKLKTAKVQGEVGERIKGLEQDRERLQVLDLERQKSLVELNRELASRHAQSEHLEVRLKEQKDYVDQLRKQTQLEFENLAQKILDQKSKVFSNQTETSLENILKPLKEKLTTFEKRVEDTYTTEAKERHALKSEVERLIVLNEKMTQETNQLTQALKGDSKFQGDWGELVLERILESSGLREGTEYTVQREHENESGEKFKPDVIVHLPEEKHIIIDSKVSLKAYEGYCRAQTPTEQATLLKDHLRSVQKHVDDLSEKHYSKLKGIRSPDFVFLFMPIEPAYLLAAQNDPELSQRAWRKNVVIVTSSNLFMSLRTVASIWRLENQKKNADEIASEAARLYDKFVGFLEDFEKIGRTLEGGTTLYVAAMGKLKTGPGNIFRKMEVLRELGAEPTKRIRSDLLE